MKIRQTLLLLGLLLFPLALAAQDAKQALNDQLWEAARKGDAAAVTSLLDKGADVNAKFRYGSTALFKAAERGNTEVVKVLLARGADVTVKDTFYGASAMTWALQNEHFDVVRALIEKSTDSIDEILLSGARGTKLELVRIATDKIATDKGLVKPEVLMVALEAAVTSEPKNEEIIALLKKAGAVPPSAIPVTVLDSYVGKYKGDPGPELDLIQKDGRLFAQRAGQPPVALMAFDRVTFQPIAFDSISFKFKIENGKAVAIEFKQGTNTTLLKRQ